MRKILSVFLTLTLLLTVFAGSAVAKTGKGLGSAVAKPGKGQGQGQLKKFTDIKGHWGELSITKMLTKGLLNGYEDGSFRPDNTITQAEAAVLIERLVEKKLNITDDDEDSNYDDEDLTGVPDWAKKAVKKGVKNKYLNLKRFHSQVQCNRLMVSVALAKALDLDPVKYYSFNPFKDRNLIPDEDYGYLLALYKAGYIKGYLDGNFNPNRLINRAEMACIIERLLGDDDVSDDNTAPEWPSDSELSASDIGSTKVYLSWTAASDNEKVTGYKVIYSINDEEKEKFVLTRSTTITGLEPDKEYEFTVEAKDAAGNWSDDGPSVEVTTKESSDADETTQPYWSDEYLTASSLTSSSVTLKWAGAHDNFEVTKYRIYKDDVLKYTVDADENTKIITGLNEDTDYTFRVEAGDAAGNWSTDGPEIDVTTKASSDTTKPYWVNDRLTVSNITQTSVTLEWHGAQDNKAVDKYKIYVNGSLYTTINDGNANSKTISGLNAGINYTFKVEAGDEAGNLSTDGPSISVSTQG